MAAAHGTTVTQAHTDYCAAHGHAAWTRDGRDTGVCARCGDVTMPGPTTAQEDTMTSMPNDYRPGTLVWIERNRANTYASILDQLLSGTLTPDEAREERYAFEADTLA